MTAENGTSLEILRGADPRILDAVEQGQPQSTEFTRQMAQVNAPMALRILRSAKDKLTQAVPPDEAFTSGVQEGLAIAERLSSQNTLQDLESTFASKEPVVAEKKSRISRWLGMKAAKFALATGVIANLSNRGGV